MGVRVQRGAGRGQACAHHTGGSAEQDGLVQVVASRQGSGPVRTSRIANRGLRDVVDRLVRSGAPAGVPPR